MTTAATTSDPAYRDLFAEALAVLRQDRATGADYRPADLDLVDAWRACIDALPRALPGARAALAMFLAERLADVRELVERARGGCGPTPFLDEIERVLDAYA